MSCGTLVSARSLCLRLRGYHPLWPAFPGVFSSTLEIHVADPQPRLSVENRFRLFPFRSPLLRESFLLSFPPGTQMFHFPGCPPMGLCIHPMVTGRYPRWVSPFGYLRLNACLRLPVTFRSLPRPSSALGALASTLCPYLLDHFIIYRCPRFLRQWIFTVCVTVEVPITLIVTYKRSGSFTVTLPSMCSLCGFQSAVRSISLPLFLRAEDQSSTCDFPLPNLPHGISFRVGGSKWTRTTGLALIRRVL